MMDHMLESIEPDSIQCKKTLMNPQKIENRERERENYADSTVTSINPRRRR